VSNEHTFNVLVVGKFDENYQKFISHFFYGKAIPNPKPLYYLQDGARLYKDDAGNEVTIKISHSLKMNYGGQSKGAIVILVDKLDDVTKSLVSIKEQFSKGHIFYFVGTNDDVDISKETIENIIGKYNLNVAPNKAFKDAYNTFNTSLRKVDPRTATIAKSIAEELSGKKLVEPLKPEKIVEKEPITSYKISSDRNGRCL
jgi:hypothetical protein